VSRVQWGRIHLLVVYALGVQGVKARQMVDLVRIVRRVNILYQVVHAHRVERGRTHQREALSVNHVERGRTHQRSVRRRVQLVERGRTLLQLVRHQIRRVHHVERGRTLRQLVRHQIRCVHHVERGRTLRQLVQCRVHLVQRVKVPRLETLHVTSLVQLISIQQVVVRVKIAHQKPPIHLLEVLQLLHARSAGMVHLM